MSQFDKKQEIGWNTRLLRRALYAAFALTLLLLVAAPKITLAESTNRNDVRAKLAEGGWSVVYGDLINEADYALFVAAVASAGACECPTPIYEYFDSQLQAQLNKIERTAPDIAMDALEDLMIRAFNSKGQSLRRGKLEISAGLATYKRWESVIYDEPYFYKCKQKLPFPPGAWTWSECPGMKRVEKTIPYPNNFQPYFRFRWSTPPAPSSNSHFQIKFNNKCSKAIYVAIHFLNDDDGQWTVKGWYEFTPGEIATIAYTKNSIFEYYGKVKGADYSWSGTDNYLTVRDSSEKYGFRRVNITMDSFGTWTQNLSCTNLSLAAPRINELSSHA